MTTYIGEKNLTNSGSGDEEGGDVHKDLYRDGPLKEDGTWLPRGGSELYFHSHLSEPDDGLESDGLAEPIDRDLLRVARSIIKARYRTHFPDNGGPDGIQEAEARKSRLAQVVEFFDALPRGDVDENADRIEIRKDGSVIMRLAGGEEHVVQTDETGPSVSA